MTLYHSPVCPLRSSPMHLRRDYVRTFLKSILSSRYKVWMCHWINLTQGLSLRRSLVEQPFNSSYDMHVVYVHLEGAKF